MASICSRLIRNTCIPALLSPQRLESDALEARDLGLEEAQVHQARAVEVLPLHVLDPIAFDCEDGDALAVGPVDLDIADLAATQQPEGAQEEIVRTQHHGLLGGLWREGSAKVGSIEVSPSLL
jgi:hypothetical protein